MDTNKDFVWQLYQLTHCLNLIFPPHCCPPRYPSHCNTIVLTWLTKWKGGEEYWKGGGYKEIFQPQLSFHTSIILFAFTHLGSLLLVHLPSLWHWGEEY
ncbi:uncharacterized protein LY89DRAFT_57815 [Mollisia scopiformis]|uniref:Uncharacterized protein n=1 Tax=Mollisia scopiformis TaxID=149040 RepID=A0A194XCW0_MOLSC|nr:uncharacterized protein LY89DRAFT_57815 [Mollisia scopiformis]KUJ17592.1 hypothetical protein LY89DRAFT_57815 [Mollisia scopiformis]